MPIPRKSVSTLQADCQHMTRIIHEMSESFGQAIDAKDCYTKNHSDEVAVIAHCLALAMGLNARTADIFHIAGHLHDIGKIGVPDAVLQKPGPLTREEWKLVALHPGLGASILSPVKAMKEMGVADIVRCHHERFDGTGYPDGLAGRAIPLGARVIAVADSVSAMLQRRPYREGLTFETACRRVLAGAGTQFDPEVVEAFMATRDKVHCAVTAFGCSEAASPKPDLAKPLPPLPGMARSA